MKTDERERRRDERTDIKKTGERKRRTDEWVDRRAERRT
jgi:hypothetical protein